MHFPMETFCKYRMPNQWSVGIRFRIVWAILVVLLLQSHSLLWANVRYVSDVVTSPTPLPAFPLDDGSDLAGQEVLIGNTGLGGIFIDAAPALDNPPDFVVPPVDSDKGNIGVTVDGVGRVELTDGNWNLLSTDPDALVVGDAGFGLLDLFTSSLIDVEGGTIVGKAATGQGQVTINTIASRLQTGPLTVGEEGVGSVDVSFTGSIVSTTSILGNMPGSSGTVTLNDTSRWDLRGPLSVGTAGTPSAHGFLNINDQALLQARSVSGDNAVKIAPEGFINMSGGTIRQLDIDASGSSVVALPILNGGVIRGDGFINAAIDITPTGELRNAALTANLRERLLVSGVVTNDGTIESLGGEMEFESVVTNNLELIARDAVMRFPNGLINNGITILGGETTIHGDVDSSGGGLVTLLPNSEIAVASDFILSSTGVSLIAAIGDSNSTLTVAGMATLDGLLSLNYTGSPSQPGDSYDILFATGGINGMFANSGSRATADGRLWDITTGANVLTVTATALATAPLTTDFNGDGFVDALDLLIWENNYPIGSGALQTMGDADGDGDVDGADFLKIQMDLGGPPTPLVATATAVPEPSSLLLVLSAVALGFRRRV